MRCLHKLLDLLHTVALHSDKNKMNEDNLAMVFAPSLLKEKDESDSNPLQMNGVLTRVITNMLRNYDTLFGPFTV